MTQNLMMPGKTVEDTSAKNITNTHAESRRATWVKASLPILITVVAGAACYGLFVNRGLGLPILGYSLSPAERLLQGEIPYRDFIYNYTPGVLWLNALLMKTLGASVIVVNAGLFVFKLASLVALFYIARRLTCNWAALVPVGLTLIWIGYRVIFRVYPTQYSMLFVLLGILFMLNYDRTNKARWLFFCGITVGLVFLFKHNVGVLLLATSTAVLVVREILRGEKFAALKKASIFWAGFFLVAAALVAYLSYTGTLGAMLNHFTSLAGEYGDRRAIALPSPRLLWPIAIWLLAIAIGCMLTLRKFPKLFEPVLAIALALGVIVLLVPDRAQVFKQSATAAISYFPILLFATAFIFLVWQFNNNRHSKAERASYWHEFGPVAIVWAFAFGAYLEMYPRADYAHLVRVLPPVFLLLFLMIARSIPVLKKYFQDHLPAPRRAAIFCAAAPLVFLLATGIKDAWQPRFDSSLRLIDRTPLNLERAAGLLVPHKQAVFVEQMAAMIEANSSPDQPIFSFAPRGTAFYFLTGRQNPTRFVWWRSVGIKKADRELFLSQIAAGAAKLILVPEGFQNERIREVIGARYHPIGSVADIAVYDRNP